MTKHVIKNAAGSDTGVARLPRHIGYSDLAAAAPRSLMCFRPCHAWVIGQQAQAIKGWIAHATRT